MMSSQLLSAPGAAPGPAADLRLRRPVPTAVVRPTAEQRAVIENTDRRVRVLAGPGTGKTATLVEAVAQRITDRGVPPEQVLVLTFSRRAAAELTGRITQRLGVTTREPIVRTLHGYAFAVLRHQAAVAGDSVPRLLAAGESDQVVRELLAGHLADGGGPWPEPLRPALASPTFAAELRDLMLRTAERGITPGRLAELGRRRRRPEWQAAARFAREYQDVADLRQGTAGLGPALDQAELTRAALALLADDTVLAQEQSRVRRLFVDEYQDVDPAQAALIERLASGADELIVFGDPDQAIYAFRGSQPGAMRRVEADSTIALTISHRLAPAVLDATRRVAEALPGGWPHRELAIAEPDGGNPPVTGPGGRPATAPGGDGHGAEVGGDGAEADGSAPAGPETVHPDTAGPDTAGPDTAGPDTAGPDTAGPDTAGPDTVSPDEAGGVAVRTFPTAAGEAAFLADELRRAHLRGGIAWSRMAVLVRSPARDLPPIRRALATAGVPCSAGAIDPAADDPVVRAILAVLRYGLEPQRMAGEQAVALLTAPGIGLDTDSVRRLRRRLRTVHAAAGPTADLVAAAVLGAPLPDDLPADLREPVLTARSLLDLVGSVADEPDPRVPLWLVWQRLNLADDLLAASLRGGRAGQRADRSLDAVLALFDLAGELAERLPYAGIRAFLDQAVDRRIAVDPTAGAGRSAQGVALLSAHAAKGLEWDVVCLAGVSEGCWPVLRRPHSLLGLDELLDAEEGIAAGAEPVGGPGDSLQEERRLFYVGATRARHRLVATSVHDQDTVPSRFLSELAGSADLPHGWPARPDGTPRRRLQLAHLVADLRRTVAEPSVAAPVAELAARQLARLAAAGVDGAHPRDWYGLAGPSTAAPPVAARDPVTLSPSAVESVLRCPLRAVLERRGGRSTTSQQQIEGVVMHALVDGLARGVGRADLEAEMERFLAQPTGLPPWLIARTRRALHAMLAAAQAWIADLPADRRPVATEASLSAWLPRPADEPVPGSAGAAADSVLPVVPIRPVRVRGRADRIDRAPDGSLIIVDFKTGATVPSRAAVEQNAQLAVYQLALYLGAGRTVSDDDPAEGRPGGAEMVYLRSGTPTVRQQPALDDDAAQFWTQQLRHAAEFLAAASSVAVENRSCERCPVRGSCPVQPSGRQVTR